MSVTSTIRALKASASKVHHDTSLLVRTTSVDGTPKRVYNLLISTKMAGSLFTALTGAEKPV